MSTKTGNLLKSDTIHGNFDFVLIITGNAVAISTFGRATMSIRLSVLTVDPESGRILNIAHCAEEGTVTNLAGATLKESATCVHKLDKGSTYVLQADHRVEKALRAGMTLDWVLISRP